MGLDMYVYKIKKLDDETKNRLSGMKDEQLYQEPGITVFDIRGENKKMAETESAPLISHINRYLTDIPTTKGELDFDLIKKDNGIPEDWDYGLMQINSAGLSMRFFSPVPSADPDKTCVDVSLSNEERAKYWKETPAIASVAFMETAAYWRKAYDLADAISEACDVEVENCGYYPITKAMHAAILEYDGEYIPYKIEDGWRYVYHEWY